mgnify:FL=1
MSDTMTEGVIVEWHKQVGDQVESGDVMAEVETDKATMELESYTEGTLLHIGVETGESVPINAIIAVVGEEGEAYQSLLKEEAASSESDAESPQESPATTAAASSAQGSEDSDAERASSPAATPSAPASSETEPETAASEGRIKASPLARRLAEERGIDLQKVQGSGDHGRIVRRDIESYQPAAQPAASAVEAAPSSPEPASIPQMEEGYEDVKLSQMRKTIARRLSESKFNAPHFYLKMDIDMERAWESRQHINEYLGFKVSFNDMIIKAAAMALRKHPDVNVSWMGDTMRYYKHVHIGVAVAVPEGLIVPVIRHADALSLSAISQEVKRLAQRARDKKLQPEEFQGNTFSISNLGMFDIDEFTGIINPPDACILAAGKIAEQAVVRDGALTKARMMKVTLSCDHRAVDGATGAQFLQTFKALLENPVRMIA